LHARYEPKAEAAQSERCGPNRMWVTEHNGP